MQTVAIIRWQAWHRVTQQRYFTVAAPRRCSHHVFTQLNKKEPLIRNQAAPKITLSSYQKHFSLQRNTKKFPNMTFLRNLRPDRYANSWQKITADDTSPLPPIVQERGYNIQDTGVESFEDALGVSLVHQPQRTRGGRITCEESPKRNLLKGLRNPKIEKYEKFRCISMQKSQ